MTTHEQVRRIALALPDATEQDHHGFPSYRVRGKIFATAPNEHHLNVMLDEDEIDALLEADTTAIEELWWGSRRVGVRVTLSAASRALVEPLLQQAWRRRAPKTLRDRLDGDSP